LAALGVLSIAFHAHAAAEGAHAPDWGMLALQILNTAILAFVLVRFARAPVREFLAARRRSIQSAIAEASDAQARAQGELEALRARLARVEREAEAMLADAEARAQTEREQALARAALVSARIKEEARRVAEQEIERARQALRAEASELAVSLAEGLLRESVRPEDDARLVRDYGARVGGAT
jgi:F-type H+-transporting ATPase subunit b